MIKMYIGWQGKYSQAKLCSTHKFTLFLTSGLCVLISCSQPKPVGKAVFLANRHISFILPDSNLSAAKPYFWGPDCSSCEYSRTYFFHNLDSTIHLGVTVKVYPDTLGKRWPWKWLFDEQQTRDEFRAKNRNFATIERLTADSVSRTVVIDAHSRRDVNHSFMRNITIRQGQHQILFDFFVPDNPQMRAAVANSQASIFIDPKYLASPAESYQNFRDHP
jgi:hypothetical protein